MKRYRFIYKNKYVYIVAENILKAKETAKRLGYEKVEFVTIDKVISWK